MHYDPDEIVKEFLLILKRLPDDRNGIHTMIDFLSGLRYRQTPAPVIEFMTILKQKKPILFQHLKHAITKTSPLRHLLQLNIDYQLALERLGVSEEDVN